MRSRNTSSRFAVTAARREWAADAESLPFSAFVLWVESCGTCRTLPRSVPASATWIPRQLFPVASAVFQEHPALVDYAARLSSQLGGGDGAVRAMLRGLKPLQTIAHRIAIIAADGRSVEHGRSLDWPSLAKELVGKSRGAWHNLLFQIASSSAFDDDDPERFLMAHVSVIGVVRQFYSCNRKPMTDDRQIGHVLIPPIWVRKIRARYMSALQLKSFCELFELVVRFEEECTRHEGDTTAVLLDKDLLNFFVAIPGRKEVGIPRPEQWSLTIRHCRFVFPILARVQQNDLAISTSFGYALNVVTYGSAAAECLQITELCCMTFDVIVGPSSSSNQAGGVSSHLIEEMTLLVQKWYLKKTKATAFAMLPGMLALGRLVISLQYAARLNAGSVRQAVAIEAVKLPLAQSTDGLAVGLAVQFALSVVEDVLSGMLNAAAQSREVCSVLSWLDTMIQPVIPEGCGAVPCVVDRVAEVASDDSRISFAARFRWTCSSCSGCNTASSMRCYHCITSSTSATREGHDTEMNHHAFAEAARVAGYWICSGCSTITKSPNECAGCGALCPERKVPCRACALPLNIDDVMCSRCGTQPNTILSDLFFTLCGSCGELRRPGDNTCCRSSKAVTTVSHFQWACGCGKLCSPTSRACQFCSAARSEASYTCPHCSVSAQIEHLPSDNKPATIDLCPLKRCSSCRRLHPRDEILMSRRLAHCLTCGKVAPPYVEPIDGRWSCRGCRESDFAPVLLADLPWSCHECGTINDERGGVVCGKCECERVSLPEFSEHSQWTCRVCGFETARGFACPRCHNLHAAVSTAGDASLWRCTICRTPNPSWTRLCRRGCDKDKARSDSGGSLRFAPWRCSSCAFFNAPGNLVHCFQCASPRPPVPCGFCGTAHTSLECPPALRERKLSLLESELLAAGSISSQSMSVEEEVANGVERGSCALLPFSTELDTTVLCRSW